MEMEQSHMGCSSRALKLSLHTVNNDFGFSGGNTLLRLNCQSECIMFIQFEFSYEWRKKVRRSGVVYDLFLPPFKH